MGVLPTLVYVALTILSPADLFPNMVGERLLVWVALIAIITTLPELVRRVSVLFAPASILIAGFIAAVMLSRASHLWLGGAIAAVQNILPSVVVFFLVAINFQETGRLRLLGWVLVATTFYVALAGVMAYSANNADSPYLLSFEDHPERGFRLRGLGFLLDPNDFGQQICISLALLPVLTKKSRILGKILFCVAVPLFLYAIYLTQSRGTLLGLGAVVLYYLSPRIGKTKAVIASALLLAVYVAAGFALDRGGLAAVSDDSSAGRLTAWGDGLSMLKHAPIFGAGYRQFDEFADRAAHNSFVNCFAELGFFGYACWVTLIVIVFKQLNGLIANTLPKSPQYELAQVARAYRCALIAFLVTAWFLSRTYVMPFYLLCGAGEAMAQMYHVKEPGRLRFDMSRVFGLSGALQLASIFLVYFMIRIHWFGG